MLTNVTQKQGSCISWCIYTKLVYLYNKVSGNTTVISHSPAHGFFWCHIQSRFSQPVMLDWKDTLFWFHNITTIQMKTYTLYRPAKTTAMCMQYTQLINQTFWINQHINMLLTSILILELPSPTHKFKWIHQWVTWYLEVTAWYDAKNCNLPVVK